MKRSIWNEVPAGQKTRKRNIIEPIQVCPICSTLPTFCHAAVQYGYCMRAVDGINKCTFRPKIEEAQSFQYAVMLWNNAVAQYHHDKLLRKKSK